MQNRDRFKKNYVDNSILETMRKNKYKALHFLTVIYYLSLIFRKFWESLILAVYLTENKAVFKKLL